MTAPDPKAPVTLALIAIAGDPDKAAKAMRMLPRGHFIASEVVTIADLRHTEQAELARHALAQRLERAIAEGWPQPQPASQTDEPVA